MFYIHWQRSGVAASGKQRENDVGKEQDPHGSTSPPTSRLPHESNFGHRKPLSHLLCNRCALQFPVSSGRAIGKAALLAGKSSAWRNHAASEPKPKRRGAYLYAGTEENDHEINAGSGGGVGNSECAVRPGVSWHCPGYGDRPERRRDFRRQGVGEKFEHWFGAHHPDQRRR